MWKRGGRSLALDRAQERLYAQRKSRGNVESLQGSTGKTRLPTSTLEGSVKTMVAPQNTHTFLSDLSDLSSVSSAPGQRPDIVGSATTGKTLKGEPTKDPGPQSPLGGGKGSRFFKKVPAPATNSSQTVSKRLVSPADKSLSPGVQVSAPRSVSSSLRGSQNAALNRLAQIESRISSRRQTRQEQKAEKELTFNLRHQLSPPVAQSPGSPMLLSAQSSNDQSFNGKLFLKKNTAVAMNNSNTAGSSLQGPDVFIRSRFKAADTPVSLAHWEAKSARLVSGVSLESDEEDMKKLLGDSPDSMDNSCSLPRRPSSIRMSDKIENRSNQKVCSTPPAYVPPSSSSRTTPPRSPALPLCSSPFRFTGLSKVSFSSPPVLSPSPPCGSTSPLWRLSSIHREESPQRSPSSMSSCSEVMPLEELFPAASASEDPHSEENTVSSEEFRMNVMVTLDDLVPDSLGFTEETQDESQAKHGTNVPASLNREQTLKLKKEEEKDVLDYQSDFESETKTEPEGSGSQLSEDLEEYGSEGEVASEVREDDLSASQESTEDDYSSAPSTTSCPYTSSTPDNSLTGSPGSNSTRSHGSQPFSGHLRRPDSTGKVSKEAAVQTVQPDPLMHTWRTDVATLGAAVDTTYKNPSPVFTHVLDAEKVEALSTFNPAAFALNELLKQQLTMTRQFINSSRYLYSSRLRSLEPPNYRYTTLEDTKKYISKHRPPKLATE